MASATSTIEISNVGKRLWLEVPPEASEDAFEFEEGGKTKTF
jgi:hypothetical protein